MELEKKQSEVLEDIFNMATHAYKALKLIKDSKYAEVTPKALKYTEVNLHGAHEYMRTLNKDIFSDDGQEYPVIPFDILTRKKDKNYE